ncbi:MAG TPA: cation:proton antiporter [Ktedonobacterales bacterium]|nr:cation:proton antiporter [Ktedonobacterales bacterium]
MYSGVGAVPFLVFPSKVTLAGGASTTAGQVETLVALLALALVTALFARRLRFPYTLALTVVGLALGLSHLLPNLRLQPDVVLFIFLPALLFESAWNSELRYLVANWVAIALLAGPGLVIALFVAAAPLHWGAGLPWLVALLLAAIVAPTDPIAVVALLRQLGMSARLRVIIEGESLFNDGVGAAAYTIVLSVLLLTLQARANGAASAGVDAGQMAQLAASSAWLLVGGPLIGLAVSFLVTRLLRRIEDRMIEVTITVSVAYGVYLIADALHTSGLLAVICAGLTLGYYGRRYGISHAATEAVNNVWDFIAYVANSLLFLALGAQLGGSSLLGALGPILWAVLGVFAGRVVIVYALLPLHDAFARWLAWRRPHIPARGRPIPVPRGWRPLIALAGLRGALSLALALSLPVTIPQASLIQQVTYGVVLVTLLGQGLSLRALLPHWPGAHEKAATPSAATSADDSRRD